MPPQITSPKKKSWKRASGSRLRLKKARETWNNVQEKAIAGAKATDQIIRDNPYKALGIALGVGAIIGYLLRRRD